MRRVGRRKPSPKQTRIADRLRSRIVRGELAPGSRLPTRSELEQRFRVSSVTVQRALDRLSDDGFVLARGRKGTFVADHPPHLSRYGLVFPDYPTNDASWPRFWSALSNEALRMQQEDPRRITIFHGIDGHPDAEDYARLLRDVRAHRLAGLIFAANPFHVVGTPILDEPGIPRVAVMPGAYHRGVAAVDLDQHSFIDKALGYLAERGRRRIALLSVPGMQPEFHAHFDSGVSARGMTTRPYWTQSVLQSAASSARNLVHLLMHGSGDDRPDGLVISDDNLVEHATAGLVAAGVRVPGEVDVVAHCNFPWPTPSVLPLRRLGYDAREVLRACMETVDRIRRGEEPALVRAPALFEDEVAAAGDALLSEGAAASLGNGPARGAGPASGASAPGPAPRAGQTSGAGAPGPVRNGALRRDPPE